MATKEKALQKSKLRHAEYYDFQNVQDQLYADSTKGKIFSNIIELIILPENIKLAYRNIKKNPGSMTAGTDGRNIKDLAKLRDEQLLEIVRRKLKWYVPQSVRRVEIPKPDGKKRPLGIPTIMDRLIQQCVLQVLEPICEAKFHDHSYGFRPNRSTEHAIALSYKCMQQSNYHYVVDIDIKGFFDNVHHGKLLKQMWTLGIRDKKLLSIISVMLKAEVAGIGFPKKGTPQGGIISPLLSNIVLNELDWWLASQWEEFPTRHKYTEIIPCRGTSCKSHKYEALRANSRLKECCCVRYADDFKIFTNSYENAVKLFHATKDWLKKRLELDISPDKSKIVKLREHYSEFLGFKMRVVRRGKKKNGQPKYVVESHIRDKAIAKIEGKIDGLIYKIQFPGHVKNAQYKAVSEYNAYVSGIHNYYNLATHVCGDLGKVAFHVQKSLKARLKKRFKTARQMRKRKKPCKTPLYIQERYGKSKQLRFVGGHALIPIGYIQHKNPMNKRRDVNSYTPEGRIKIHSNLQRVNVEVLHYIMRNPIPHRSTEYNDNRLSLYSAQLGKCAISGQELWIGNIHCHHKVPRRLGGRDNYQNLVLVTEAVHRLIHATSPEITAKYMETLCLSPKQLKRRQQFRDLACVESCLNEKQSCQ